MKKHLALVVLSLSVPLTLLAQSARDPIPLDAVARPTRAKKPPAAGKADKPAPVATRPKLVVVVVADMFRADYLVRFAGDFGEDGFKRLLREGASFDGHYGQQNTYTGPGHALIATGSYGYVSGIIQNKWFNRESGRSESMFYDPASKLLVGESAPDDETSPRNIVGTTLGDELRLASPQSRVVALALKDRGAIALAGRMGQAYFQSDVNGEMTSSTYYLPAVPEWVTSFNAGKPVDAFFGKTWDRLLPAKSYPEVDDQPFETAGKGLSRTLPKTLNGKLDKPGPDFYAAFQHAPQGVDVTFDFALAAVDGEKLGQRGVTDLLGVSISGTDLSGHAYGPYSQEVHDVVVRLDRQLAGFLGRLDGKFAPGEVWVVFTADHGAVPIPEWSAAQHIQAARLKKAAIKAAVNKALSARFGAGEWVVALEDPSIYLDRKLMAAKNAPEAEVERVAGEAALTLPGILGYHTRTQLLNGWLPPTRLAQAVSRSFSPTRSGDVVLVQAPFSFWGKYAEKDAGTSHGSAYRYDTDVPLVFVGRPFAPGHHGPADMVDLAATLAHALGLTAPAACEGRSLFEGVP